MIVVPSEQEYKFQGIPLGFHRRIEWKQEGILVSAMGVGDKLQVKARDSLAPDDFGDRFLTVEETRATAIRLMFYPTAGGFHYYAAMDRSEQQPPMTACLMIHGDYTLKYETKDFGSIGNGKTLVPGQLWADHYFYQTVP